MCKFGFIVPVYKVKTEFLKKCVESILRQTYQDFSIVLVDDGSPDESGKYCDELSKLDARIKVVHHDSNLGLPAARNTGIDNINADWIAFVDADDWVDQNMCEILAKEMETIEADIYIYSGYRERNSESKICKHIYDHRKLFATKNEREMLQERFLDDQTIVHIDDSFPIQSACIRLVSAKLFKEKKLRFHNVRFAEDAIFHLYSTEYADRIVYLNYNFYHYRDTEGSMVNSYRDNADKEQLGVMQHMWDFSRDCEKGERFIKKMYLLAFISMQMCIWQKFFNLDNPEQSYIKNRKECKKCFESFPYNKALEMVDFGQLRRNQKIKYILLKLRMYKTIVFLRNLYNR